MVDLRGIGHELLTILLVPHKPASRPAPFDPPQAHKNIVAEHVRVRLVVCCGHYPKNIEPPQGVPWAVLGVFECFIGFSERIHCLSIITQPLRLSSRQEYHPIHHYTEECGAGYEGDYGLIEENILTHLNEHRMQGR